MKHVSVWGLLLGAVLFSALGQAQETFEARFETAWRLVQERYWDPDYNGVDWHAMKEVYRPQALAAAGEEAFFAVLAEMYAELGDDHSVFVSPARVDEIRQQYGDLPCLGLFSSREGGQRQGNVKFELLAHDIGYLLLPDLATPGTSRHLRQAVQALSAQRAQGFILDLRGNPGGRLVEMMQAAGIFTSGFLWRTVTRWTLPLPYPAIGATETDAPLVVLIDRDAHSAAEGLAGALQAAERATVIGETSAGNVEAVLPFCLRDGSQAWIATGVLAPLHGSTWNGRGVEPDIVTSPEDALEAAREYLLTHYLTRGEQEPGAP